MAKSAEAFRTISEVAEWLGSPAHVLRFWESKFSQVKPVKRAGGRRYYRPADMLLLGGIKKLLHDDGMTIKGVQKVLREQGVKHVAGLSQPLGGEDEAATIEATLAEAEAQAPDPASSATVLKFQRDGEDDTGEPATAEAPAGAAHTPPDEAAPDAGTTAAQDDAEQPGPPLDAAPDVPGTPAPPVEGAPAADTTVLEDFASSGAHEPEPASEQAGEVASPAPAEADEAGEPTEQQPAPGLEQPGEPPLVASPEDAAAPAAPDATPLADDVAAAPETDQPAQGSGELPGFLHRSPPPPAEPPAEPETAPEPPVAAQVATVAKVDVPPDPSDDEINVPPGLLSALAARQGRPLAADALPEAVALRDRLAALVARQSGATPE